MDPETFGHCERKTSTGVHNHEFSIVLVEMGTTQNCVTPKIKNNKNKLLKFKSSKIPPKWLKPSKVREEIMRKRRAKTPACFFRSYR